MAVLIPPLHNFAVQRSRRSTLYLGDCGLFSHLDTTSSLTLACTFTELQYTPPKLIFQLMPTILVSQVPHIHESQDKEARVKPRDQEASLLHDNAFKACSSHGRPPSRSHFGASLISRNALLTLMCSFICGDWKLVSQ